MTEPSSTSDGQSANSSRPRVRRWLRDLLLIVVVVALVQWWQSRGLVAGTAPPLAGIAPDGTPYQLDPADGPTLVHFWAEWCPICRTEQDSIDSIAADLPVITVATTSGPPDDVAAYLREHGSTMPVVMDENGDLARAWGVDGVPTTFIVGRDGEIEHAGLGYSTEWGLRLRMWLAQL